MSACEAAKHKEFADKICRLTKSAAYLGLCEEVCGCREYMFNMIDAEQLDFLLNKVPFAEADTVLDLGCGNGGILRLIAGKYGCSGIGVDTVSAAQSEHSSRIEYICGDINDISDYAIMPTIALSVDGLYFDCDLDKLIHSLRSMKVRQFCLFWSQYLFDECKDRSALQRDKTALGAALKKAGIGFTAVDFGENEYKLYQKTMGALEKYKNAFTAENNLDLYVQKVQETKLGIELYEKGFAGRYLYAGEF